MFQSIEPLSTGTKQAYPDVARVYSFAIIDTDFGTEEWIGEDTMPGGEGHVMGIQWRITSSINALMSCYGSKELDVAFNLALYHRFMRSKYQWYTTQEEMGLHMQWNPGYKEHAARIDEYLARFDNMKAFE